MSVPTNNEHVNHFGPPIIVQKRFVGGLVDKMHTLYPTEVESIEQNQIQSMRGIDREENQEQILKYVIHFCFANNLPIHKLLE